ncbi:MAG: hypothetical protein LBN99_05495 [Oscillospiraceae bacterium]|jgi:predicted metal-dependent peptidase|nr:hypothetical protein [Oscillospiraceae bacterium]
MQKRKDKPNPALESFKAGCDMVARHPIFSGLFYKVCVRRDVSRDFPSEGLAVVEKSGVIYCNSKLRAEPDEWARALAHCVLHLAMGHFVAKLHPIEWNIACDCVVEKFLSELKFGGSLTGAPLPDGIRDEDALYEKLLYAGDAEKRKYLSCGTAGAAADMSLTEDKYSSGAKPPDWPKIFAEGLANAVQHAVSTVAGHGESSRVRNTASQAAKQWFISSYLLLGAIAANFKIIEDPLICQRMQISVAAISPAMSEIYINPAARLDTQERRFVMAHEFLHAALRHDARCEWRDAYLWNVACDYVINGWLTEMGVGERPDGVLYDEQFKGQNAETIYDRIVCDMRTYRKLATLRGVGLGDVLPGDGGRGADTDLDAFYRRALAQGLTYHRQQGRGYLPEGLVEEIRALGHPPIPWDVELARWFDEQFTPLEKTRSYARPSRRQASTPDIPRPNWMISQAALDGRTFGVLLDTSGSMERALLASALGAIASYSAARDVPAARVVFCDAAAYDAGYMKPEDIAGSVKVRGRGGTVLQPGVDLLENADDFPDDAPILIITDGECDRVVLRGREHAFLLPRGASLPFEPRGKVFRMV